MQNEETNVLSALRREPEQTAFLFKLSAVTAIALVAWDVMGSWVLPDIAVKAVMMLLILSYGAAMTYFVARIMASSRSWATSSASAATKLARPGAARRGEGPGIDLDALRRRPNELPPVREEAYLPVEPIATTTSAPTADSTAFNESYFLMQLQEQIKDARRQGHEMSVAAVHVTIPGQEMTPDIGQVVAYDMALLASGQSRVMSPPLALNDSEFVFSLPHMGPDDTRTFVREIVRAFGDYWCYFGIASFPRHGNDAADLVERARAACETSLQSGKRSQVEYSAA